VKYLVKIASAPPGGGKKRNVEEHEPGNQGLAEIASLDIMVV